MSLRQPAKITVISCSASEDSLSRRCLVVLPRLFSLQRATMESFDVRDLPSTWVNDRAQGEYPEPYQRLIYSCARADGLLFLTPIYGYTANSATKVVAEVLGGCLQSKPIGFITASGTSRSFLAIRDMVTSMMFEFEAICFPESLQLTQEMMASGQKKDTGRRLRQFVNNFTLFVQSLQPYYSQRVADPI